MNEYLDKLQEEVSANINQVYNNEKFFIGLCQTVNLAALTGIISHSNEIITLFGEMTLAITFLLFSIGAICSLTFAYTKYLYNQSTTEISEAIRNGELINFLRDGLEELKIQHKFTDFKTTTEQTTAKIQKSLRPKWNNLNTSKYMISFVWIFTVSGFLCLPIGYCLNKSYVETVHAVRGN